MKKLLFVAILGTLVACGESTSETTSSDTSIVTVDSTPLMPAAPDTMMSMDTTTVVDSMPQ